MARPKLGDSESKRLQMVITEHELTAIEDWQHRNRVPSKSEAIRRLCQIGLRADREIPQLLEKVLNRGVGPEVGNELWKELPFEAQEIITNTMAREIAVFGWVRDIAREMEPFVKNSDLTQALAEAVEIKASSSTMQRVVERLAAEVERARADAWKGKNK